MEMWKEIKKEAILLTNNSVFAMGWGKSLFLEG